MHKIGIGIFIAFLALVLAGCSADGGAPAGTPTSASSPAPTAPAATPLPPTPTAISGLSYDNPVYNRDFPDPFILRVGDTYYGYSTNTSNANIPAIRSQD